MLQTILMSKAFGTVKKYWQVLAGFFTFIFLYILKERHDKNIKKETVKEIENAARETIAKEQQVLNDASEATIISHANNPLPSSWDELGKLSEKANPTAKQKAEYDEILKKLRRKN